MTEDGRESENMKFAIEGLRGRFVKLLSETRTEDWLEYHAIRWNELLRSVAQLNQENKQRLFDSDYHDRLSKLLDQLDLLMITGNSGAFENRQKKARMEKDRKLERFRPPKKKP